MLVGSLEAMERDGELKMGDAKARARSMDPGIGRR